MVEWLVRCAEEPATRWEGAYELRVSASRAPNYAEDREVSATRLDYITVSEGKEPEVRSNDQAEDTLVEENSNAFALQLTETQKHRLVDAIIMSDQVGSGDTLLIELASRWNDPRLDSFLASRSGSN
jgi:hypothetical protein